MQLFLECYPCILRQVINTAKLLDLNDKQIKSILDKTMEYLLESKQDTMPLHIVVWIYNFIHEKLYDSNNSFDPYKVLKHDTIWKRPYIRPQLEISLILVPGNTAVSI